jgi:hypothetical protein
MKDGESVHERHGHREKTYRNANFIGFTNDSRVTAECNGVLSYCHSSNYDSKEQCLLVGLISYVYLRYREVVRTTDFSFNCLAPLKLEG